MLSRSMTNQNEPSLTHESSGVGLVGPDLSVDLDQSLLDNSSDFTAGKGVLQSVSEEDGERERLSELVRTGRRSGGLRSQSRFYPRLKLTSTYIGPAEFVEHP